MECPNKLSLLPKIEQFSISIGNPALTVSVSESQPDWFTEKATGPRSMEVVENTSKQLMSIVLAHTAMQSEVLEMPRSTLSESSLTRSHCSQRS